MISVYCNMDVVIREIPMIRKVHGFCALDEEGRGNIYLNSNDTPERRRKTLKHELIHYVYGHHYMEREAAEAETRMLEPRIRVTEVPCGNT